MTLARQIEREEEKDNEKDSTSVNGTFPFVNSNLNLNIDYVLLSKRMQYLLVIPSIELSMRSNNTSQRKLISTCSRLAYIGAPFQTYAIHFYPLQNEMQ